MWKVHLSPDQPIVLRLNFYKTKGSALLSAAKKSHYQSKSVWAYADNRIDVVDRFLIDYDTIMCTYSHTAKINDM